MKAIILVALLACAASAFSLNSTAYHLGFSAQLGWNSSEIQDGFQCFSAVGDLIQDVQNVLAFKSQNLESTLFAAYNLMSDLKYNLKSQCQAYGADLQTYLAPYLTGAPIGQVILGNFEKYYAQVIQEITVYGKALVEGNDYLAGQTEASILQILYGVEQPEVLPVPQINDTEIVAFNATAFYTEFYTAMYNAFGYNNQTGIDMFAQCGLQLNNLTLTIVDLIHNFSQQTGLVGKVALIQTGVNAIFDSIDYCTPAFSLEMELAAPIFQAFHSAPLQTIATILYNEASNLPELIQNQQQLVVDVVEGEYDLAGELEAQKDMIIFNGIMNFDN